MRMSCVALNYVRSTYHGLSMRAHRQLLFVPMSSSPSSKSAGRSTLRVLFYSSLWQD
jgi:hypothetical protein